MVFGPLKAMATHSGNAFGPALFQYPPAPTLPPLRSPSFTALAGYPALAVLEAHATPPLARAATFIAGGDGGLGVDDHASTSTIRDHVSGVRVITTRMRSVVTAGNVTRVQTWRFPVMLPPGTVAHALPAQYCTWKSLRPYQLNLMLGVGSSGAVYASCTLKTSISV